MRVLLLTALVMVAFAANSVLNRVAIVEGGMDAVAFGGLRLVSGALVLAALVAWQGKGFALGARPWVGTGALLVYVFGFSAAYQSLDAGVGALVLFGVVQVTMFYAAVVRGEMIPKQRTLGSIVAGVGLVLLLWPSAQVQVPFWATAMMVAAGVGWGAYSLAGQGAQDATQSTAMNFILAAPFGLLALWGVGGQSVTVQGFALAVVSGAVTSGLGYALWYAVIPYLGASRAAVAQLTVPVIAMGGGMVFLSEEVTLRFAVCSVLVLGGVALSLVRRT